MIPALGAIGSAWLLGTLLVALLWPRERTLRGDGVFILGLGLGVGLGVTSGIFFFVSMLTPAPRLAAMAVEMGMVAVVAVGLFQRRSAAPAARTPVMGFSWLEILLATAFVQGCVAALVVSSRTYAAEPHGSWDAWAIWNLRARMLIRGGENWPASLHQPELAWSHLDYPLLVPASVARGWALVGHELPLVAGLISTAFAVATVVVLVAGAAALRNRPAGWAGGLLLVSTPFFVTFAPNQHADISLGFFILATLAVGALTRRAKRSLGLPALAGICAGLATWTKNEGLLFALVVGIGGIVVGLRPDHRRATGAFVTGLLVALVPTLYFKFFLAPANDLVDAGLTARLGNLFDASRHGQILWAFGRDLIGFGEWAVPPFVVMLLPLLGAGWRRFTRAEGLLAATVVVTTAGYYAVYLITPWDLRWHLDTSLVRLLLQLWPAGLFFWCLALPPLEVRPTVVRSAWPRIVVLGLNGAVAALVVGLFSRQLAPNELAAANIAGERTSLVAGDGWFPAETDGKSQWRWSKGDSVWFIDRRGTQPATVTLRFNLRGIGQRTARITSGERVLWHGPVHENLGVVEIAGVAVAGGTTELQLTTDTPGVLESAAPGARALTFAVYDPEVK
jgi:hypothetical protein